MAPVPASSVTTVVTPGPPVVVAVRELSRLETAEFRMERVIDLRERQHRLGGLLEADDTILLVAAARVSAGVDLRALDPKAVRVDRDGKRVRLTLPAPQIFEASLDNDRTYVHARDTDLLADRAESLETRARKEAEKTLRDAALEAGILKVARGNAERTVSSLLRSLGFVDVAVEFEKSP